MSPQETCTCTGPLGLVFSKTGGIRFLKRASINRRRGLFSLWILRVIYGLELGCPVHLSAQLKTKESAVSSWDATLFFIFFFYSVIDFLATFIDIFSSRRSRTKRQKKKWNRRRGISGKVNQWIYLFSYYLQLAFFLLFKISNTMVMVMPVCIISVTGNCQSIHL